jgi:hypothetical protein
MKLKKLFGLTVIASPFVSLFIFSSYINGVKETAGIFVAAIVLVAIIWLGVHLVWGEEEDQ